MKKLLSVCLLATSIALVACNNDDDDRTIDQTQLPETAQTFITTHFADLTLSKVTKDNDGYDAYFTNGHDVDFDKLGNWDDVDCKNSAVPSSVQDLIPSDILSYVSTNYPSNVIVEINKETYGFEIGLNNNVDLEFDSTGKFLRRD